MGVFVPERRPTEELLDGVVSPAEAEASLRDIEWVHRNLGGRRMVRRRLAPILESLGGPLTVLDIGCGSGHVGRDLERFAGRNGAGAAAGGAGRAVRVLGLDMKVAHARLAPRGRTLSGDALRLPFVSRGIDVVVSTLFLHHFSPDELRALLTESARVARRAVVAFDLGRSRVAHGVISVLGPLFFESPVSIHDGRASVRQAYTCDEAASIAAGALPGARVTPAGPFAWQLLWTRPDGR